MKVKTSATLLAILGSFGITDARLTIDKVSKDHLHDDVPSDRMSKLKGDLDQLHEQIDEVFAQERASSSNKNNAYYNLDDEHYDNEEEEEDFDNRSYTLRSFSDMTPKEAGSDALGTDPVQTGEFPYFSAIRQYNQETVNEICNDPDSHCPDDSYIVCGASLIAPDMILTAGHCNIYQDWTAYIGLTETKPKFNGEEVNIVKVWEHPDFIMEKKSNGYLKRQEWDFKIAKIDPPVENVEVAVLNTDDKFPSENNQEFVSLGLGKHSRDHASKAYLNTVPRNKCSNAAYTGVAQICSRSHEQDVCTGDSGGPMVADGKLVGLVSSGPQCAKHMDHSASVFALVSYGMPFITNILCDGSAFVDKVRTWDGEKESGLDCDNK